MPSLEELFAALPDVGLSVRRLDQWEDGTSWTCVLEDGGGCSNMVCAPTALEAVVGSLRKAGVDVSDG